MIYVCKKNFTNSSIFLFHWKIALPWRYFLTPSFNSSCYTLFYHSLGALFNLQMHLCNFQMFPSSIISNGGQTKASLLISLLCRNAEVISRECSSHDIMEAETKTFLKAWQPHAGEPVLSFIVFSSADPCFTNRVFNILLPLFFFFSVKTDHDLQSS